jgi:DNA-binding GntR family transcriptional regulator
VSAIASAPAGPQTTPQHALDGLRRAIVRGELKPGQRVAQEDVALRLGVSIAPVREALRVLEQEGQVVYRPRRGYFVTELRIGDLEEIYALRQMLEERAARRTLTELDEQAIRTIKSAAADCLIAAESGDVATELAANRRFHFAMLDSPGHPHTMRVIRLLWDSTEAYGAIYYNSAEERRRSIAAHARIIAAIEKRNSDRLIRELDAQRNRALEVLRAILPT